MFLEISKTKKNNTMPKEADQDKTKGNLSQSDAVRYNRHHCS